MIPDTCIKTPRFPLPGQNLYWIGEISFDSDVDKIFEDAVNFWYAEYKNAKQADIDKCCGSNFDKIGHFTQVVHDSAIAVGCAASQFTDGVWNATLVACNYSHGNVLGDPVYLSGKPASKCLKGRDSVFTNLCKI